MLAAILQSSLFSSTPFVTSFSETASDFLIGAHQDPCGQAMAEFKQFFYAFCGKRKVQPVYTYEEEGSGFYCEVRKS